MHTQIYLKLHLFPRLPFLTVRSQSLQVRNASRFTSTCEIVLLASHQGAANPGGVDVIAANRTRPKGPLCPEEWLGFQHFANFTAAHFVAKYHAVSELFAKTPSVSPVPEKAIFRSLPTSRTLAPKALLRHRYIPQWRCAYLCFIRHSWRWSNTTARPPCWSATKRSHRCCWDAKCWSTAPTTPTFIWNSRYVSSRYKAGNVSETEAFCAGRSTF